MAEIAGEIVLFKNASIAKINHTTGRPSIRRGARQCYVAPMRISFLNLLALFAGVAMAIALVLSCGKTTSAAAEPRKAVSRSAPRLALVIGNANYATVGRLANPARDARLIADKLKELGFEVTEKTDRDLKGLTDDIDEFAREIRDRGRETVSLFY